MKEKLNIEQLIKSKLEGAEITPSSQVWKKTIRSYRRKQFMRFKPGRFNIFYATGIILSGLIITAPHFLNNNKGIHPALHEKHSTSEQSSINNENTIIDDDADSLGKHNNETSLSAKSQKNIKQAKEIEIEVKEENSENHSITKSDQEDKESSYPVEVESLIAYFTPSEIEGCAPLNITFTNGSINASSYTWKIGSHQESFTGRNLKYTFNESGTHIVTLTVSNTEGISQSYSEEITVHPAPKAEFLIENDIIYNNSINATDFEWSFSDNTGKIISSDFQPFLNDLTSSITEIAEQELILVVKNVFGCPDTARGTIPQYETRKLEFPSAFLLNKNGTTGGYYNVMNPDNTIFHPKYDEIPATYELKIYNKSGELIFISTDIQIGWDGYHKEAASAKGVYVYVCNGTWNNGEVFHYRGDITLL